MNFIPVSAPVIGAREIEYVTDAVRSGWVSSIGPYVERFEQAFAAYLGVEHAIAVSNGTVGLHLALHSLGIGPGDEVLVPDMTFVATANTVLQTGARPVFVDVDPETWCMDPEAARRAITSETRAIVPVHLFGHPADMDDLLLLAVKNNLQVVEDAAEAHGAEIAGRKVGGIGRLGVFSFYGNKIITTGEGGMVVTNDDELADRLRYLKDHGMSPERRYYHTELAFNYRLTNLQAALGLAQLEQIEDFIARKRAIFKQYAQILSGIPGAQLNVEQPGMRNVFWMISLVLGEQITLDREELGARLRAHSIDWRPFFVPMHTLPHLADYRAVGREGPGCPVSDRLARRGLCLPSGCNLDPEEVQYVAGTVRELIISNQQTLASSPAGDRG
jgi:perosamine synthetase